MNQAIANRGTCISPTQRWIHVGSETVAVVAVVPFMIWLATQKKLPTWARVAAAATAVGTVAVDGGLLVRWWTK